MEASLQQAMKHYTSLCEQYGFKSTLKNVETLFIDCNTPDPDEDKEPQGVLSTPAASIPMKVLYAARDLLVMTYSRPLRT